MSTDNKSSTDDQINEKIQKLEQRIQYLEAEVKKLTTKTASTNNQATATVNINDQKKEIESYIIESTDENFDEKVLKNKKPVKILLRSIDVLHNWYVPQFRAKMDAVPGVVTFYWFEPNKTGEYEVLCAEYCGVGHYAMRGSVLVQNEQDYKTWLGEQETFSDLIAKQKNLEIGDTKLAKK